MSDSLYNPDEYNFVPKFYKMNPKTEDLLPGSGQLVNGMVVLIADPDMRERPENGESDWVFNRLTERNRWCTVTNFEITNKKYCETGYQFIGVYADGTKVIRMGNLSSAWIVKLDSIADAIKAQGDRHRNVHTIVTELLKSTPPDDIDSFNEQVDEITKQLLKVL
jgi:hypothetical protein